MGVMVMVVTVGAMVMAMMMRVIWSHYSDKYSGAPGGEHSSDDNGHKYKGSPADDKQDKSAYYAAKHCSSLENSDDGSYESDNRLMRPM